MNRRLRVCAVGAAATLIVAIGVQPASATATSTGATGFASAAYSGSASMKANLTITGALGGLLGSLLTPIITNLLNPVVSALTGTASSTVGALLGPSSTFHAASPTVQTAPAPGAFPTDLPGGLPSPCSATSATQPCYSASGSGAINAAPLATVSLGALSGYTQQVTSTADSTSPIFGRAQEASTSISVLPGIVGLANPVVSTGLVDSKANCPNDGVSPPSASVSGANIKLLGGLVTLSVASGSIANLTFNGTTYPNLNALPTVTAAGVTVQPYGDSVAVSLSLSLSQILAGLGIPSSITSTLLGYGNTGTSLTLTLVIGPNTTVTNTSATAWGLGVGVDLSGSLAFSLPTGSAGTPIVGANITIPTGITGSTFGNLLDLRLAYSACAVGATSVGATQVIPPELI